MGKTKREPVKPITIKLRTAAEYLDLNYDTIGKLVARDVFTAIRAQGYGRGKRVYLHADEVELFAQTRDELAVRGLRVRMGRLKDKR
jgi:hypothetical protein